MLLLNKPVKLPFGLPDKVMSKITHWCFLGLILWLSGCAVKVNTFYDQNAPFDSYQTFCWFDNCEFTIDGPVYLKKDSATVNVFKNAIVEELERKGFIYDQNNPDFLLYMHIVVEEQEGEFSFYSGDSESWEGVFPIGDLVQETYIYLKGSIIIDIADAEESRMVWRSDAVEYLNMQSDISNSKFKKAIKRALRKFPPSGK